MTKEDIIHLFANVEVLVKVNQELLDGLERRTEEWDPNSCIGDFFLRLASFFKLYTGKPFRFPFHSGVVRYAVCGMPRACVCVRVCARFLLTVHPTLGLVYCKNYELAVQTMVRCKENPHFAEFLQEREFTPEAKGLDLGAFLIMPIQVPFSCLSPPPATLTFSCCCCDLPLAANTAICSAFERFPQVHAQTTSRCVDVAPRWWTSRLAHHCTCRCRAQIMPISTKRWSSFKRWRYT